jgi:DNA-binding MarR family transcriptional regulator
VISRSCVIASELAVPAPTSRAEQFGSRLEWFDTLTVVDLVPAARTLTRYARVLEHALEELTMPQYRLLALLARGDERASQLAGHLALTKPSVTAAIDGLVDRALVSRRPDPADRRAARLQITATGRQALTAADAALAGRLKALFARLDDPKAIVAALAAMSAALDEAAAAQQGVTGR